ncbi:TonB-dependent receptor [Helicobacter valdiviensis]|uniref:TonB-dependent receptor n=1 Tax=Helicobacter valdiviensis TaxID=1458358 RepID=A0A2W6MXX2_9HELI|nr:TonB-dependent receptor [Helicobacter valdiviensis]PZT48821.1 TonB-dependent receptor [Helicobacter valdiviensis]
MKKYKQLKTKGFKRYFSLAVILALHSSLSLQAQNTSLKEKSDQTYSLKSSFKFDTEEKDTSFKEEFTSEEIAQSNSQTLYDFLSHRSLLNIRTNYGNPYNQSIDLRGFGVNGHKNLAIVIDGVYYNNIDSTPILLSSIPLDAISKIEIIKGKDTLKYGNGATSGVLKITTSSKDFKQLHFSYSSYKSANSQIFMRHATNNLNIGAYGQYQNTEGSRHITQDELDGSYNKNGGFSLYYAPSDDLLLKTALNYSKYGIKYANPLTKEQFIQDPTQPPNPPTYGGDSFTQQKYWTLQYNAALSYFSSNGFVSDFNFGTTRNSSDFVNFNNKMEGNSIYTIFNTKYQNNSYMVEFGNTLKNNKRDSQSNQANVKEALFYTNGEKYFDKITLNGGLSFNHINSKLNNEKSVDNKIGAELGISYKIHPQIHLFTSYTRSFIAPNVDFMFDFNGKLNPLIKTATFDTYQIGQTSFFGLHKLETSLFLIEGKNEAFFEPNTYTNKSLSKTQRIGFETKFTTHYASNFYSSLSYAYVEAKNKESAYYNKEIPGVLKHTFVVSANYLPLPSINLGLSYKYGSRAYDYNDFTNTLEKMPNYQSLNATLSYTKKDWEIYGFINNLTGHKNAVIASGGYYPYEFERTFGAGVKYRF